MASTDAVTVHPSNRVQLSAWDGDEGAYWAAHADQFERALTAYHDRFFTAAAIEDDHRVLDVGCGTGRTTRDAARRASHGSVVGVDLSAAMLEVARRRADTEGLHNVTFEQADAQIHPFGAEWFDVAIACTSAMFFGDRVAALATSAVPCGRAVGWYNSRGRHRPATSGSGSSRRSSVADAASRRRGRRRRVRSRSPTPTSSGRCSPRPATPTSASRR
jgi:SAM-dependent methyltransferase